jgi:hypothetical protein
MSLCTVIRSGRPLPRSCLATLAHLKRAPASLRRRNTSAIRRRPRRCRQLWLRSWTPKGTTCWERDDTATRSPYSKARWRRLASLIYAYALYDLGSALRLHGQPAAAVPVLQRRLQIDNQRPTVQAQLELALRRAS